MKLTICIFQRLFLLGGLGDDLDAAAIEETYFLPIAIEQLDTQHEVLALVRVGYVQGLGCTVVL